MKKRKKARSERKGIKNKKPTTKRISRDISNEVLDLFIQKPD